MWTRYSRKKQKFYLIVPKQLIKVYAKIVFCNIFYVLYISNALLTVVVLSNPHHRAIYDTVGIRGLKTEGWEIVERTRTPQEIREEYEYLAREAQERKLLSLTNPTTSITMNINATDLFNKYEKDPEDR